MSPTTIQQTPRIILATKPNNPKQIVNIRSPSIIPLQ